MAQFAYFIWINVYPWMLWLKGFMKTFYGLEPLYQKSTTRKSLHTWEWVGGWRWWRKTKSGERFPFLRFFWGCHPCKVRQSTKHIRKHLLSTEDDPVLPTQQLNCLFFSKHFASILCRQAPTPTYSFYRRQANHLEIIGLEMSKWFLNTWQSLIGPSMFQLRFSKIPVDSLRQELIDYICSILGKRKIPLYTINIFRYLPEIINFHEGTHQLDTSFENKINIKIFRRQAWIIMSKARIAVRFLWKPSHHVTNREQFKSSTL